MVRKIGIGFSIAVTLAFGYGVYEALSYAHLAKIFPLYVSGVLFVLAIANLIQELRASNRPAEDKSAGTGDLETEWGDIAMSEVLRKFAVFIFVIAVLYASTWLIGYPVSITVFIILLYRYVAGSRWWAALVAGAAGLGFLALVSKLLYMDWPEGLLKLPWPLG